MSKICAITKEPIESSNPQKYFIPGYKPEKDYLSEGGLGILQGILYIKSEYSKLKSEDAFNKFIDMANDGADDSNKLDDNTIKELKPIFKKIFNAANEECIYECQICHGYFDYHDLYACTKGNPDEDGILVSKDCLDEALDNGYKNVGNCYEIDQKNKKQQSNIYEDMTEDEIVAYTHYTSSKSIRLYQRIAFYALLLIALVFTIFVVNTTIDTSTVILAYSLILFSSVYVLDKATLKSFFLKVYDGIDHFFIKVAAKLCYNEDRFNATNYVGKELGFISGFTGSILYTLFNLVSLVLSIVVLIVCSPVLLVISLVRNIKGSRPETFDQFLPYGCQYDFCIPKAVFDDVEEDCKEDAKRMYNAIKTNNIVRLIIGLVLMAVGVVFMLIKPEETTFNYFLYIGIAIFVLGPIVIGHINFSTSVFFFKELWYAIKRNFKSFKIICDPECSFSVISLIGVPFYAIYVIFLSVMEIGLFLIAALAAFILELILYFPLSIIRVFKNYTYRHMIGVDKEFFSSFGYDYSEYEDDEYEDDSDLEEYED